MNAKTERKAVLIGISDLSGGNDADTTGRIHFCDNCPGCQNRPEPAVSRHMTRRAFACYQKA